MPTAGMRVAPEVLVLELYREIFFSKRSGTISAQEFSPNPDPTLSNENIVEFSNMERAVIFSTRGRKKQNPQSRDANFYTPAFPGIARFAWLRRRSDRVIRDFLFRALSQRIHGRGPGALELMESSSNKIYRALVGNNTSANDDTKRLDILGLEVDPLCGCMGKRESLERLMILLGKETSGGESSSYRSVFGTVDQDDPLATRIYDDFISLCELEKRVDRLQWLDLLKCFLRLATSMWLLAHMRLTIIVHNALLSMLTMPVSDVPANWPAQAIKERHQGLLQFSITPTSQVQDHLDNYMRSRVELNLLVALIDEHCTDHDFRQYAITATEGDSLSWSLDALLVAARDVRDAINADLSNISLRDVLTRKCEHYRAWVSPHRKGCGQGVNYDEFLRVLRRMTVGDEDGGYLLTKSGTGFVVFPGQLMLKLMAYLSGRQIERRLVLSDLENHFAAYGIDFGASAGARPRLISTMQEIGMLRGSPDAGDSVEIERPYG